MVIPNEALLEALRYGTPRCPCGGAVRVEGMRGDSPFAMCERCDARNDVKAPRDAEGKGFDGKLSGGDRCPFDGAVMIIDEVREEATSRVAPVRRSYFCPWCWRTQVWP